jgi:hypothetical protein
MSAEELTAKLQSLHACHEAREWAKGKSLREAWETCERADWMLWYAARVCDRKTVVLAACACARRDMADIVRTMIPYKSLSRKEKGDKNG